MSSPDKKMDVEQEEIIDNLSHLDKIVNNPSYLSFQGECIRKRSNWSSASNEIKFDNEEFNPDFLLNEMKFRSPKLVKLLKNIDSLDDRDVQKYGKKFKHFIFSDLKSGSYGAKMLASALIAKGMTMGYSAALKNKNEAVKKTQEGGSE